MNKEVRILVVDDEGSIAELAVEWLAELGYTVESASGAAEALRILDTVRFDILFTDIVMPGEMDGLGLAREAVARYPWIRVVLASGYSSILHDQAHELPGPLITKPYRKRDLVQEFKRIFSV